MTDEQRYTGIVETWIDSRGFGFIRRDGDTGRPIFIHARDIKTGRGHRTLAAGEAVEFEIGSDAQGRWQCENLVVLGPGAALAGPGSGG
jgi:cold shock CspA family protein